MTVAMEPFNSAALAQPFLAQGVAPLLSSVALSACVIVLLVLFARARVRARKLEERVELLLLDLKGLDEELKAARRASQEKEHFLQALSAAQIITRLQEPRLKLHKSGAAEVPEKYRYVSSMVAEGFSLEEIARSLSLSVTEARQLMTLARMARKQASG